MIKGGVGGANTQTGLRFEERIRFSVAISKLPDYKVVGNEIFYKEYTKFPLKYLYLEKPSVRHQPKPLFYGFF